MENAHGRDVQLDRLRRAFAEDGFEFGPEDVVFFRDRLGVVARHRRATTYQTGQAKVAYYIEGTPYEMGYLMGRLAEPQIDRMTETFIDRVFGALIRESIRGERLDFTGFPGPQSMAIHRLLIDVVREMIRARQVLADVPLAVHREIRGLVAGCREAARLEGRSTSVTEDELWVLNAGIDCVLSRAYTGMLLPALSPSIQPRNLRPPIACNGFALLNGAADDGALFGRDYMFPTGRIFHEVAAHVICRPVSDGEQPVHPFLSMTAPGIVGSIAAMNVHGVAAGIDVAIGANCNPHRPGFNSLLLVRHAIERGATAQQAVDRIVKAQRGVTWNYIVADGGHAVDRACVIEAGAAMDEIPFLDYPNERMRRHLPDPGFVDAHRSTDTKRGAMLRWDTYHYPTAYLEEWNPRLWKLFRRSAAQDAFATTGHINRRPADRNCPGVFYFAPLRGRSHQVVLTTNHFVIPEMRFCSMHPWAARVSRASLNDSQWRYDELNQRLLSTLDRDGPLDRDAARRVLEFLAPGGDYPDYYRNNPRSPDGLQTVIFGSSSLFALRRRVAESHYGYYGDPWITTTLPAYVE